MMVSHRGKHLQGAACPECGGRLYSGSKPFRMRDVLLGTFPVHECETCGEYFFTARGWAAAEKAARAKGLFGSVGETGARHLTPSTSKAHA